MSSAAFPMWLFVTIPLLLALAAFGIAQILPGAGMIFVAWGATLWSVVAAQRGALARVRHD